jgi:hypothetical protein
MAQQTAVEWLDNELWKLRLKLRGGEVSIKFYLEQEARLILQAKGMEKEQRKNDITDYNIKVTEFLLNPSFNLEHSNHGIACEKLADIRNEFIKNQ